jgi:hypothetical protein
MSNYQADFTFNNLGRLGSDPEDASQKTVYNTRFSNYLLSNYFSENQSQPVEFSTRQPALVMNGLSQGLGLSGASIDHDSFLTFNGQKPERPWERLEVQPRIFATVPFLGRGSCDPTLESSLRCGECTIDRQKSVNTVSEITYDGYVFRPDSNELLREPQEQNALGFDWGGIDSREIYLKQGQQTRAGGSVW